ncbi:MAG: chromosome segregation protein SMC [Chloroflexi bacterium]|nr:chromosome segregation protein SMC [Chloroflexota bacterium]
MSRLKELRLHGFKSFADQTRFVFEPGVNAVIGPNGSGKSNMADAVRWVLGEQSNRSLRTRRADDVIFGGSEQRKPQGMAEASLTLDNADGWLPIEFSEVSIGRRAYRSGESEYLINGARARLRDVVELLGEGRLGANELVVVGQGTVDAALSLRPEERRQLFEEAAGVKGLQVKRNEASSRLARSLDNLTRVSDLIGELKPQVRRLALQAEHQQQHDTLGSRARALVIASVRRREQAARAELGEARRRAAAAEAALTAYREAQDAGRAAVTAAEERYWSTEEASREAAARRQEAREALIRIEGRAEALAARVAEAEATLARDEGELASAEQSLATLDERTPGGEVDPAVAAAARAEAAWRDAVAELARADDELLAAEQAVAELRAQHSDLIARQARASEEMARRAARAEQLEAERRSVSQAVAAGRERTATAAERSGRADQALARALTRLDERAAERDAAQEHADATRRQVVELTERLQAMRAELDALAVPHDAASRLGRRLAQAGWPTLLDSVSAPEESWPAIEAVVGGELESALLWSDRDPSSELDDARGAARLLAPADDPGAEDREAALAAVRGTRTLGEWVGAAGPRAFARTVVAPDLAALLAGWRRLPPGWAAVTAAGDLADMRGVVLRGRGDPPGGAAARAHARRRELATAVEALEADFGKAQHAAHEATEALRAARETHLAARQDHEEAERDARAARDALVAAEDAQRRDEVRLEQLDAEAASVAGDTPPSAEPVGDASGTGALPERQLAADAARQRRDDLAKRRDAARDEWTATRRAAEEIETRTAGIRSERAHLEARIGQLRSSLPRRRSEIDELRAQRDEAAGPLEAAREERRVADAAHAAAEEKRLAVRAELVALERQQGGASDELGRLERAMQSAAIEESRRDEALAGLLREREMALDGLPPVEGEADGEPTAELEAEIESLDDEAVEVELRRVRRTLSQIGSVNPFAVEEHRELATRLGEMTTQDTDLRAAIDATQELIATLDAEIASQFDAAFSAIGARFDEYCQLLFAGGSGSLQMGDEADGDAPGGIEIVVRPPGKRLQRLAMLSGGERALTGVALLFAMLTVNPVPFCILDEVDAALDEANIGRFAQALRKLSEAIDFVVITHNRATIEVADTIYGVTMTDAAVSRVLSLRLADVPAEVGA